MSDCAGGQNVCMFSGDDVRLLVTVKDQDGQLVDISNASAIEYQVARRAGDTAVVTKTLGSGISIASPESFSLDLLSSETGGLSGQYYHEAQVTTDQGLIYTALSGRIKFQRDQI